VLAGALAAAVARAAGGPEDPQAARAVAPPSPATATAAVTARVLIWLRIMTVISLYIV
jgi:hypothetical protein